MDMQEHVIIGKLHVMFLAVLFKVKYNVSAQEC